MSERLNSVDIEDVLSSIRRLVSDDMRPSAGARVAAPPAAPVEPAQADKLILTPALRIAPEPDEPAPHAVLPAEPVMSFHSVRPERGAARLDAVMGQVARGLESGPGEWEAAAEPPARFESDWSVAEPDAVVEAEALAEADVLAEAEPLTATEAWAEAVAQSASPAPAPLDLRDPLVAEPVWTVAEHEAPFVDLDSDFVMNGMAAVDGATEVSFATPDNPEPLPVTDVLPGAILLNDAVKAPGSDLGRFEDTRDVTSDRTGDAPAEEWPVQDWAAPGEEDDLLYGAAQDAPDGAGWSEPEVAATDSPRVAMAEEPAMTGKDDPADLPATDLPATDLPDWARMETDSADPEPVDLEMPTAPAAAAHQGSTDPRWADAAEAEIRRELEDEVTASAFARFADDDLDDRPFDEDMLRDLVRDIIREELQGALGERITRNVRKLVRAEIARALAVRDFE